MCHCCAGRATGRGTCKPPPTPTPDLQSGPCVLCAGIARRAMPQSQPLKPTFVIPVPRPAALTDPSPKNTSPMEAAATGCTQPTRPKAPPTSARRQGQEEDGEHALQPGHLGLQQHRMRVGSDHSVTQEGTRHAPALHNLQCKLGCQGAAVATGTSTTLQRCEASAHACAGPPSQTAGSSHGATTPRACAR